MDHHNKRISEELWNEIAKYYESGHALYECASEYGVTRQWISPNLKKRGVKIRRQFEPSRPEKVKKLPAHLKKRFGLVWVEPAPEGTQGTSNPESPSRRKIVAVNSAKVDKNVYEKELK